jgi:ribonuclease P protein component
LGKVLIKKKLSNDIEFKRVFYKGKKREGKHLRIFILKNLYNYNRLGVVIKKEVGIAVKRNKIKRQLKEAFHQMDKQFIQGYDIIIFVKKNAVKLKYLDFLNELEDSLKSISK